MKANGFTLVELLVAIAVFAVIVTIALPSYQSYLMKSRRADAKEALATLQFAQEKWRGNHDTYTNNLADLGLSATSTAGYYGISLTAGKSTGDTYEGVATALSSGPQADDTCGELMVSPSGYTGDVTCWGLK